MSITYEDWLMHHGILGQRWGRKNGPPYPLGASDHSASERKAGWRKSLDKSGPSGKKKFKLSNKQKTALKVTAGVAAAGLAIYGGYKMSQISKDKALADMLKGINTERLISTLPGDSGSTSNLKIDQDGFMLLDKTYSDREHEIAANPTHDQHNCKQVSAVVAERIANGRDLVAKEKAFAGNLHEFIDRYYEEGEMAVRSIETSDGSNVQQRLEKQLLRRYNEGDIGIVSFDFDKRFLVPGAKESGHAFNWKIEGSGEAKRVVYLDGQGNTAGNIKDPITYFTLKDPNTECEYVNIKGLHLRKDRYSEIAK